MLKRCPSDVAEAILRRSQCAVQVGACLSDSHGIFGWGWNSSGPTGYGLHAEAHCVLRANRRRLAGATIWVAARRQRNGRPVTARPCEACRALIKGIGTVMFRDGEGVWQRLS